MEKRTKKSKIAVKLKEPQRDRELPVTKRLLDLKIQDVKSDITSLRLEMKAGFAKIDARFTQIEARFTQTDGQFGQIDSRFTQIDSQFTQIDSRFTQIDAHFKQIDAQFTQIDSQFKQIDARFGQIDARFHEQNGKFEALDSKITKMLILMEDQNDRNRVTLDNNALIYQKIVDNDARVEKLEERVFGIKQR